MCGVTGEGGKLDETMTRGPQMTNPLPQLSYFSPSTPPPQGTSNRLMYWVVWPIVWLVLSLCALGIFGFFLSPLFVLLLALCGEMALRRIRQQRANIILTYVEQATRLNLPLTQTLRAAELSHFGPLRWRLAKINGLLSMGYSLGDALGQGVPEISTRTIGRLLAADQLGQLPTTLHQILLEERTRRENTVDSDILYRFYLISLSLFLFIIVTGLMIFVVPKFRVIFNDFGVALPQSTQYLLNFADWFYDSYGWLWLLPPLLFLFLYLISRSLRNTFIARVIHSPLQPLFDWLAWYFPITRYLALSRGLTDVCQTLADALEAGLSLPSALEKLAPLDLNPGLRIQLDKFAHGLQGGLSLAPAAAAAGLPSLMIGFLSTAETSATTPAIFRFLARYYRARFSHAIILAQATFQPAMVMTAGVLVGFVVYAFFIPLVKLIDSVAGYHWGVL